VTVDTDLSSRLLGVLRDTTGQPDLTFEGDLVPLTGGYWAELLAFSLAEPPPGWPRELVLRLMPNASVARKETIFQAAVADAGYRTPAVRASGGPSEGLGRAFMVMDRADGAPLLPGLAGPGALVAGLRQAGRMPDALASAMAALHALDPQPVRSKLGAVNDIPITLSQMLSMLRDWAVRFQRDDLARAGAWLEDHPRPAEPEVICHGDVHPFNVLADGSRVTLLDWSACLIAPRLYDVAFTTSMLSEPPLEVHSSLRPLVRRAGRLLAGRFLRRYQVHAATSVSRQDLRWHQAVVSLRALTEVASWEYDGIMGERAGHPWLVCGPALAARLTGVTGLAIRPR
jgi:aminoglycoside phosphotransferase (APT) family kinase protein